MSIILYNKIAIKQICSLDCEDGKLHNIPVEEAVIEFKEEFFSYKKDVSKNHGKEYDPDILNSDYLAYKQFTGTEMFRDILAL